MTSLTTYMIDVRRDIDQQLNHLLPSVTTAPTRLHEAMRYSVFAGGKRLRPALCIASCEALGGKREDALLPAAALEALHTYTLIHDDLPAMDNDDMRRGKPSCHKAFGEATAILAGDALVTCAFEFLGKTGDSRVVTELALATGSLGTVGGQQNDLESKSMNIPLQAILSMYQKKTAALFRGACRMGGITAGALEQQIEILGIFGKHLGMAFQLFDDVCDNDPMTMNTLGREKTIALAREYEQKSFETLAMLQGETEQLRQLAEYTYASFAI